MPNTYVRYSTEPKGYRLVQWSTSYVVCYRMAQLWRAQLAPDFVSSSGERVPWISLKVGAPHFRMNCLIILLMVGANCLAWCGKIWHGN